MTHLNERLRMQMGAKVAKKPARVRSKANKPAKDTAHHKRAPGANGTSLLAKRLVHTLDDVAEISTCGRTSLYAEIRAGNLKSRKIGRRTVVLDRDLKAWLASLPLGAR